MKKAIILTSDSRRHNYFIKNCEKFFDIKAVVIQKKKNYYTQAKKQESVQKHFDNIKAAEERVFPSIEPKSKKYFSEDINNTDFVEQFIKLDVDVVLLFGTAILKSVWLNNFKNIVNLHLGLSPYYKGSATLFWPFHNNQLEYLGTTIHLATSKVDAGNILGTIFPDLKKGEDYYTITTKLIKKSLDQYPVIVNKYLNEAITLTTQDPSKNIMISKKKDFSEVSLLKMLSLFPNGLSQHQIEHINLRIQNEAIGS